MLSDQSKARPSRCKLCEKTFAFQANSVRASGATAQNIPAQPSPNPEVIKKRRGYQKTERTGFEPAVRISSYAELAIRCFRPLSHLS